MFRKALFGLWATCVFALLGPARLAAAADIVLYARDATNIHGNWALAADSTAAGGQMIASQNQGWSTTSAPLASPTGYFDVTFTAPANTPYHLWMRLRALKNSKSNDSVWVQFSDAVDGNGAAVYAFNTTSGFLMNLENCNGCGDSGWGWQDKAWWLTQVNPLRFATTGTHTMRVQIREDGVQIDQIVLSPSTYLTASPGVVENDTTIVPKPAAATPYSGTPAPVPGTIEAENFDNGGQGLGYFDTTAGNSGGAYRQTDVDIEASSENGYDVGWISPGEWLDYTVNVASTGNYLLETRVANASQGGTFHFEAAGVPITGELTIPNTGGWQAWTTLSANVKLAAGTTILRVVFDTNGAIAVGNLNWMRLTAQAATSSPYGGTAAAVPGTLRAENYDVGGEGVAYHDTTAGNAGGAYRQDDVDIEPSAAGGYDVGWIATGEWLNYTVNVASAGTYTIQVQVASPSATGQMHARFNGVNTPAVAIPNTGGWQNWTTVTLNATLAAGTQIMQLAFDTGGFNIAGITVSAVPQSPPYLGTPAAVPGTLHAENFDNGGQNVAYYDTTAGNSGGAYRSTDVDIETSTAGGYDVCSIATGEWMNYTVNAAAAGSYTITFHVASPNTTGQLHAVVNGVATPVATVPNTGGFQVWSTVTVTGTFAAGTQVMRLVADSGGFNVAAIDIATVPASSAGTGGVWTVNAGGDFQAALNAARPGDTILLQAGATFTGNFVLPANSTTSTAYITIRTSAADSALPPAGTRIDPSYAAVLPKIQSPNSMPALATVAGTHHYQLVGLEFLANYQGYGDIVDLGDGSSAQNSLSLVPHDFIIDRVYIHGDVTYGQKRGIGLNSGTTTIENSYIAEIKANGQDSQAICGWNGPGPYTITNNYLEAAGENVLFGGSDPSIPNLVPSDITFKKNHLAKQTIWMTQTQWSVKNIFELKNAQRVVVDGNVMEYNWLAGQPGYSVLFTPRNQDGTAPWTVVQHVQFTNNVVRHVSSAINILGNDNINPSQLTNDITVRNNLFVDVSSATYGGAGRFMLVSGGANITVDHNTVFEDGSSTLYADSTQATGLVFTNNIVPDNSWCIMGSNASPGNGTIAMYFPQSQWLSGVFAGSNPSTYPTGNYYPAGLSGVGFVDLAGGNYRLALTSPYKNAASDGTDIGCNVDALNQAAGTVY